MKTKFFKTLFVLLITLPFGEGWGGVLLSAQNGVTVSNLAVATGSPTTVTFNVNWNKDNVPALWSDTVWVFVDYNKNGVMTRLPLSTGATLTGTSAPGLSWVEYAANNDQGVWVVGNAREASSGSFSATVQLLTATADIAGACAYASNYPPMGEYISDTEILFAGTPMYDIVLKHSSGSTITVQSGNTFLSSCDYTLTSFTDATGVPGIMKCIPPTSLSLTASPTTICNGQSSTLTALATGGASYSIDNSSWQTATTFSVTPSSNASYTLYVKTSAGCSASKTNAAAVSMKTSGCGVDQLQGNCTYTVPAVVSTFAAFPSNYSSSTYVSLTDERDNKNYPVVKIGARWIMARNLNYQGTTIGSNTFALTWQTASAQPSTGTGSNTALIGHFWCPGASGATTSTRASCDVRGALYSWETAMMVDGKWTSSAHSSSAWTERTGYGTFTSSANTQNHGQTDAGATIGGRGICPPNWHVPTDGEWGDIMNEMETGTKNHNTATSWLGTNAGTRGKSKCSGTATDANAYWSSGAGTDNYGFRGLPAGYRYSNGSHFGNRDIFADFWSSSAYDGSNAWYREFNSGHATAYRNIYSRSISWSVRCIRD
jgi:uncharacterized protein (TIGR02145 family)